MSREDRQRGRYARRSERDNAPKMARWNDREGNKPTPNEPEIRIQAGAGGITFFSAFFRP